MKMHSPTRSAPVTAPPVLQRRPLFPTRPFAPPGAQVGPASQEAPAALGAPGVGYHFRDIPVRGARSPLPPPAVPRAMPDTAGLAAPGPASAPPRVARPTPTGLPDRLKAGIEVLSGYDLSDVRVHSSSSQPAQLQALAYTQGTDIHVAPGQEKHLAHEAWHVVQQKQGRVKPTLQLKGEQVNDDQGLEHEAEVMGAKASANAAPLPSISGNGSCGAILPLRPMECRGGETPTSRDVVQRMHPAFSDYFFWAPSRPQVDIDEHGNVRERKDEHGNVIMIPHPRSPAGVLARLGQKVGKLVLGTELPEDKALEREDISAAALEDGCSEDFVAGALTTTAKDQDNEPLKEIIDRWRASVVLESFVRRFNTKKEQKALEHIDRVKRYAEIRENEEKARRDALPTRQISRKDWKANEKKLLTFQNTLEVGKQKNRRLSEEVDRLLWALYFTPSEHEGFGQKIATLGQDIDDFLKKYAQADTAISPQASNKIGLDPNNPSDMDTIYAHYNKTAGNAKKNRAFR